MDLKSAGVSLDASDGVAGYTIGSVTTRVLRWARLQHLFVALHHGPKRNRSRRLNSFGIAMIVKALIVWVGMMLIAITNGMFRVGVLENRMIEAAAHVISTITLCFLVLVLTWATISWIAPNSLPQAIAVGILWIVLTLGFEFGFGLFVADRPWPELLAEYNVFQGRVWVMVLVTIAFAPYLTARLGGLL
jgi:hypothetical protein